MGMPYFNGINATSISKLQRAQNTAARLISLTRKHDHITPVLVSLHWLPVRFRSDFKSLLYTYKAFNNSAPVYLQELVSPYQPTKTLRSENMYLFNTPRVRITTFGESRFDKASATLWNDLPLAIRNAETVSVFTRLLKTHLFRVAYGENA